MGGWWGGNGKRVVIGGHVWGLLFGPSFGVSISFKAIRGCVLGERLRSDSGRATEPRMTNYVIFRVIHRCRLRHSQHAIPTRTLTLCAHSTLLTQAVFLLSSLHLVDQRLVSSGGVHDAEPGVAEAVAGSAVVADLVGAAVVQPLRQQLRQGLNLRSGEVGVEQRKDAAHGSERVGWRRTVWRGSEVCRPNTHTRAITRTRTRFADGRERTEHSRRACGCRYGASVPMLIRFGRSSMVIKTEMGERVHLVNNTGGFL